MLFLVGGRSSGSCVTSLIEIISRDACRWQRIDKALELSDPDESPAAILFGGDLPCLDQLENCGSPNADGQCRSLWGKCNSIHISCPHAIVRESVRTTRTLQSQFRMNRGVNGI